MKGQGAVTPCLWFLVKSQANAKEIHTSRELLRKALRMTESKNPAYSYHPVTLIPKSPLPFCDSFTSTHTVNQSLDSTRRRHRRHDGGRQSSICMDAVHWRVLFQLACAASEDPDRFLCVPHRCHLSGPIRRISHRPVRAATDSRHWRSAGRNRVDG